MGHNDHIDYELADQLSDLLDEGYLIPTRPAYGVALQVIDQGLGSLTPKQRVAFDAGVWPAMRRRQDSLDRRLRAEALKEGD